MLKFMAVLRTIFLVFIVIYTLYAMQVFRFITSTFDEQYALVAARAHALTRTAWLAVAWIALETLIGWLMTVRAGRRAKAPPAAPAAPAKP
jgi:NADH:ubiquinone oxidoreductase subunit 6 (subunit J)